MVEFKGGTYSKGFENLEIWNLARAQAGRIFKSTLSSSFSKDFSLKDQILRSTGSVMDNIAEGYGRRGTKEFRYFLYVSLGSNAEVRSQLYRAYDRKYLSHDTFSRLYNHSREITAKIKKFIKNMPLY